MLETLKITNLALIEDIYVEFEPGFTVLTGETGAGKSIILGALGLLLGQKADGSDVRTGAQEASILAKISLPEKHALYAYLLERDIPCDEQELIIRRTIKSSGRGSMYVNSIPVTKIDLQAISQALFDIHGQHEHQSLLRTDRQRMVLDNYANVHKEVSSFGQLFRNMEDLLHKKEDLINQMQAAQKESDYIAFVSEELAQAKLKAQEDTLLEDEIHILSQYETIHENLSAVKEQLKSPAGEGALNYLTGALSSCRKAAKADPSLEDLARRLEIVVLESQDIADSVRDYLQTCNFSQKHLDELQERLSTIQRLKKKYGPTLDDVLAFRRTIEDRISSSAHYDESLQEIEHAIVHLEKTLLEAQKKLTEKRTVGAANLEQEIAQKLSHLGMPHVVFRIMVSPTKRTSTGADQVLFLFSANLGEPLKELREIASGGELSRVMLAIKSVLASSDDIGTVVFDEIDSGIGGAVAIAAGQQMAQLSTHTQVIAITHLASIAAQSDAHLLVHKEVKEGRTYTLLEHITGDSRVAEIARMLSGTTTDHAAILHAEALLQKGRSAKI